VAHIQRRCSTGACRRVVPPGTRRCPACGSGRSVWVARVRGPDGAERSKAFRTRVEAERFTASSEISKARGEWVDPALGRISLGAWASSWLHAVEPALKPKTVRSYDSLINSRITPAIGNYPIRDLAPMDIQRWVNAMRSDGLSASRIPRQEPRRVSDRWVCQLRTQEALAYQEIHTGFRRQGSAISLPSQDDILSSYPWPHGGEPLEEPAPTVGLAKKYTAREELAAIPVLDGRRSSYGIAIRHLARAVRLDLSVPKRLGSWNSRGSTPPVQHNDPNEGTTHGCSS
jgi:Phage integrase, N-terminal SAM-like domain